MRDAENLWFPDHRQVGPKPREAQPLNRKVVQLYLLWAHFSVCAPLAAHAGCPPMQTIECSVFHSRTSDLHPVVAAGSDKPQPNNERRTDYEIDQEYWAGECASRLWRGGRRPLGTGDGGADPHRRLPLLDGFGQTRGYWGRHARD